MVLSAALSPVWSTCTGKHSTGNSTPGARAHCLLMASLVSIRTPRAFSAELHFSWVAPSCPHAWGYSSTGLGIFLYWASCGSCQPISPTGPNLCEWQHTHLVCQPLLPVLYNYFTFFVHKSFTYIHLYTINHFNEPITILSWRLPSLWHLTV